MADRETNAQAALRVLEQANVRIHDGLGERCIRALLDAGLVNSKIGTDIPVSELLRFAEALLAQGTRGVRAAPAPMPADLAQRIAGALECGALWTEGAEAHPRMQKALADFNEWRNAGVAVPQEGQKNG